LGPRLKESGYETTDDPESLRTALAGFDEASRNARSNAMSPEVQAELEDARSLRKKLGVINNGHFIARHDNPINLKYSAIIDTVANRFAWQSQQAKNEYLQLAKSSRFWNPGRMDPEFDNWFQAQVNAMEASPVDKQTVWNEFAQLRQMQNERTQAAREYVSDNSRYEAFKAAEQEKTNQQYESQLKADVTSLCNAPESPWAYLKERMEKPLAAARDATERAAFEKHNREVYQPAHDLFRTVIGAVSSGTNGAARVALEFMRLSDMANVANDLARQLREAQEKVAELEKARGTLKKEVTTNRQVKDAWAKPRNGTSQPTPEKARLPKGPDGGLHKVFDTLNKEGWGQH